MNIIHSAKPPVLGMDALQLHAAARCLAQRFGGARLRDLRGRPGGIQLGFGREGIVIRLLRPPLGVWAETLGEESETHPFIGLARQQLQGYTLHAIEAPYRDRILCFRFERGHLSGRRERRALLVEWRGHRSNLILLEDDGRMRFAWRWDDLNARDARVLPQQAYRPPPGLDGGPLWFLAPRLQASIPSQADGVLAAAEAAMKECVDWFLLARGEARLPYPIALPGWDIVERTRFADAWPNWIAALGTSPRMEAEHDLRQRLQRAIQHAEATLAKVAADRERLVDPERYRRWGQALHTLPDAIPTGDTVTALDYHAEPPAPLQVPVTPGKGLHQQAEAYFRRARKAERGLAQAQARHAALRTRCDALLALERDLETGHVADAALRTRLTALDPDAPARAQRPAPGADHAAEPLRVCVEGYEILVGRSARQNDHLTFRLARPWDLWLHVQDRPGAHVLIRLGKQEKRPPDAVLSQAALLALRHSPRAGKSGDVDWTLARFVSRKPGGAPGQVLYRQFKTWHVQDPDA